MIDYERELRAAVVGDRLTVPPAWEGFAGQAFGGFLAGTVLVAAAGETEQPRPLSLFARYRRPVPVGTPVGLSVVAERRGRTVDVLAARLLDGERQLASFSMAFGGDRSVPLQSQAVAPMQPLLRPRAIAEQLDELGVEVAPLMRRVGFRGETAEGGSPEPDPTDPDWHLRSQWPDTDSADPAVRAAVALMPIDNFVGPATMVANRTDLNGPWPVRMPSLDLTGWFYAPEAAPADADAASPQGWLRTRTSSPVSNAGHAVGRTQVWAGDRLVAEGMSQVVMIGPAA